MNRGREEMPAWDELLSAGARLQGLVPGAVLVGGTAAAMVAGHRFSRDADHVVGDLIRRFDEVLADLEGVAGWTTARIRPPVLILGSLDGVETGIRQMIRTEPLETQKVPSRGTGSPLVEIPTPAEILRIKAALVLKRNATRDYVDVAALSAHLGGHATCLAITRLDALYPQPNGQSAIQQLIVQLDAPQPYDLEGTDLSRYKGLAERWHRWTSVRDQLRTVAADVMGSLISRDATAGGPIKGSAAPELGRATDEDLATIVDMTKDITHIGPGRTQGRVSFDWDFLDERRKAERLAFLDQHPRAFKERLIDVWRARDPEGVAAWKARGGRPIEEGS